MGDPTGDPPRQEAGEDIAADIGEDIGEDIREDIREETGEDALQLAPPASSTDPAGPEQIEWQPVVEGDTIEWRPVVVSEGVSADVPASEQAEAEVVPPPDFEYPEEVQPDGEWEPLSDDGLPGGDYSLGDTEADTAVGAPAEDDRGPTKDKTKRQVIILSVLSVAVVAVGILGFVLSRGATEKGSQVTTATTSTPSNTLPRLPESALQTYSDDVTGFTVKFAKTWETLRSPNADIRLIVNAGGNDAFSVRVAPVETPATVQNIENFKAVTDAVVFGDKTATSVKQQLVTVNGLLAYYYLYTFHDSVTNQEAVHARYFIFEGNRMFILTLQSVPAEDFARQASLWDQVAESFTVQPRPTTTTTAAPTTTVPATTVP